MSKYCLKKRAIISGCSSPYSGALVASGYSRIVYGDHGPYIEFQKDHIQYRLIPKFGKGSGDLGDAYYEWMHPEQNESVKVYRQLRTVRNKPNPPYGGFMGNRKEGYADYRVGMYYIAPEELVIVSPVGKKTRGLLAK